ncbi:MAG: Tetratricopeptide repeat protein, partial [Thermodesulfobacteriota bacterium]|nr:Tetratricopeptide repeat protein [Thermodesulfobacteriota bacterium]
KKEKENQHPEASALFQETGRTAEKPKFRIYGMIVCILLGLGLALLFILDMPDSGKIIPPAAMLNDNQPAGSAPVEAVMPVEPGKKEESGTDPPGITAPGQTGQTGKAGVKQKIPLDTDNIIKRAAVQKPKQTIGVKRYGEQGPRSVKSPGQESAGPFYEKAVYYHRQNRLKEAIVMYLQVLDKNPGNTDAQFNLASAYLKNREFAMALPVLQDLSEKDRDNPQIMINHAIARMGMGEPAIAVSLLDAAQQITGVPSFELYFHKAAALSQMGRLDEAKTFYEKAGKIDPENDRLLFNMAVLYDKMKLYGEALQYYRLFLDRKVWSSDKERKSVDDRVMFLTGYTERQKNMVKDGIGTTSTGDNGR